MDELQRTAEAGEVAPDREAAPGEKDPNQGVRSRGPFERAGRKKTLVARKFARQSSRPKSKTGGLRRKEEETPQLAVSSDGSSQSRSQSHSLSDRMGNADVSPVPLSPSKDRQNKVATFADDGEDPFQAKEEKTTVFFHRLVKRQATLKTSNLLQGLGLVAEARNVEAAARQSHEELLAAEGNTEEGRSKEFPSPLLLGAMKTMEHLNIVADEKSSTEDEEGEDKDETEDEEWDALSGTVAHKDDIATCLCMHQRAVYLHQTRTALASSLRQANTLAKEELGKIEGRLDSKMAGMLAALEDHRRQCTFLKKGLERQLRLQLANVANRGWFKTGHGGNVNLVPVMRPFVDAKNRREGEVPRPPQWEPPLRRSSEPQREQSGERAEDEFVGELSSPPAITLDQVRPFYRESLPIPVGGRTRVLVSRLRQMTRQSIRSASNEMGDTSAAVKSDVFKRRLELEDLLQRDTGDFSVSPLEKARLKCELFDMTRDEALLEPEDWRYVFPRTDLRDLTQLMSGHQKTADAAFNKRLAENNVFTHVYLKGSLRDGERGRAAYSGQLERFHKIRDLLRRRVGELRDDEEIVYNLFVKAKRAMPRFLQSSWIPSRFRDCLFDEADLLRIIRKRYYEDKDRKERLRGVLPGGLSACTLEKPPRPRVQLSADIDDTEPRPVDANDSVPAGWRAAMGADNLLIMSQLNAEEMDETAGGEEIGEESGFGRTQFREGSVLRGEDERDPFGALNDRQFTQVFLEALEINPRSLLTGEEDSGGTRSATDPGGDAGDASISGLSKNRTKVDFFACQTRRAAELLRAQGALEDVYQVLADKQPAVVLEVAEPCRQDKGVFDALSRLVAGGNRERRATIGATGGAFHPTLKSHDFFQLSQDKAPPIWVPTLQRKSEHGSWII
eukprot:Gregarina_sp_Poly_1__2392@NODE_163_length_12241_cov_147_232955_g145_i0_p1_GENE_NODE_163_length_12241_cov_147_232955_g145_i0NODE_163_length_12241_cov_147_232955_g145_i0_p1_ORF_typecomplete_len902_score191_59_NODE_163_length_12241_cov_147_232955_g145_i0776110466